MKQHVLSKRSESAMPMNKIARGKASAFLKEYRLSKVTLGELKRIITSQGYTIVEFHHVCNDEQVTALIAALGLDDMVKKAKGFTYADRQRRLVFLHEDLSDTEKLLVLAHEEGHIYCGHISSFPVIGRDVVEEYEANEFTHYILDESTVSRIGRFINARKALCGVIAIVFAVCVVSLLIVNVKHGIRASSGNYYITAFGDKYHEEACIFVKDKTDVRRMTADELESGEYEPCGICLPN